MSNQDVEGFETGVITLSRGISLSRSRPLPALAPSTTKKLERIISRRRTLIRVRCPDPAGIARGQTWDSS